MAREIAFFTPAAWPALIVTVNNGIRALLVMKGRGTNLGVPRIGPSNCPLKPKRLFTYYAPGGFRPSPYREIRDAPE
jgi:hypothetical protein